MIDMILIRASMKLNDEKIKQLKETNKLFKYQLGVNGFKTLYTIKKKGEPSAFKLFTNSFTRKGGYDHTIEVNPNKFNSILNLYALLETFFEFDSLESFKISRLDIQSDIKMPFKDVKNMIYRKNIRSFRGYVSDVSGEISTINLGKAPKEIKIYDKYLERVSKTKTKEQRVELEHYKGITRIEAKLTRTGRFNFPIENLHQIKKLCAFDPFEQLDFLQIKRIETNLQNQSSKKRNSRLRKLKKILEHRFEGSAQIVYQHSKKKLGAINKCQQEMYFESPENIPDLFSTHQKELKVWLNPKEHIKQDLGGGLIV